MLTVNPADSEFVFHQAYTRTFARGQRVFRKLHGQADRATCLLSAPVPKAARRLNASCGGPAPLAVAASSKAAGMKWVQM